MNFHSKGLYNIYKNIEGRSGVFKNYINKSLKKLFINK